MEILLNKKIVVLAAIAAIFALLHTAEAATAFSKPPNNLGLVGYWSFNEGTGSIAS